MMNLKQKAMLERAKMEAQRMGNDYVGSEHLLLALLHGNEGRLARELAAQGIYYFQVREDAAVLFGMKEAQREQRVTAIAQALLEQGERLAKTYPQESFEDCMGEALLAHPTCVAMELLRRYDVNFSSLSVHPKQEQGIALLNAQEALRCLNFGERQGFVEREEEMGLLVEILLRKEKANPLLVGEAGVGKSALVEALACRIEAGEIPALKGHYIYALDLNALVAGTRYRGDFEEKMKKLLALFRSHPRALLFIDELHQMIGAGKSEGSIDVASVIKPCLARRELRCIGATTLEEYERYIEKDQALARRFQCVRLKEPDKLETKQILTARLADYSGFHKVEIAKELIPSIVSLADYYLPFGHFPDKALDVLDLSCAHAKANAQPRLDERCVREVIAQLSLIPMDAPRRAKQTAQLLRQRGVSSDETLEKRLRELGEETCGETMLGCWEMSGERGECEEVLRLISEEFFHQAGYLSLDMHAYPFLCKEIVQSLRRNPYTILCIEHFSETFEELRALVFGGLHKGELRSEEQRVSLRHTLVVFLEEERCYCDEIAALANASFHFARTPAALRS